MRYGEVKERSSSSSWSSYVAILTCFVNKVNKSVDEMYSFFQRYKMSHDFLDLPPEIIHDIFKHMNTIEFSNIRQVNQYLSTLQLSREERIRRFIEKHGRNSTNIFIQNKDLFGLKYLLDKNFVSANTILIQSSKYGYLEGVEFALHHGANIHESDDASLRLAAEEGHLQVTQYLVLHGANRHARNNEALRLARLYGHWDIVIYLKNFK